MLSMSCFILPGFHNAIEVVAVYLNVYNITLCVSAYLILVSHGEQNSALGSIISGEQKIISSYKLNP